MQTMDRENERLKMLGDHLRVGWAIVTDNAFDIAKLQMSFVKRLAVSTVVGKHGEVLMLVILPEEEAE